MFVPLYYLKIFIKSLKFACLGKGYSTYLIVVLSLLLVTLLLCFCVYFCVSLMCSHVSQVWITCIHSVFSPPLPLVIGRINAGIASIDIPPRSLSVQGVCNGSFLWTKCAQKICESSVLKMCLKCSLFFYFLCFLCVLLWTTS